MLSILILCHGKCDDEIFLLLFERDYLYFFLSEAQVLVHEWAKLRWGVYEEHGYPGWDEVFMRSMDDDNWVSTGLN